MFIPLGFPIRIRIFPWAIVGLLVLNMLWSIHFFKEMKPISNDEESLIAIIKVILLEAQNNFIPECKTNKASIDCLVKTNAIAKNIGAENLGMYPKGLTELKSYKKFIKAKKNLKEKQQELGMFSWGNFSYYKLLMASFTHLNYAHLLGNMLFLVLIGIWVEQRAGAVTTLVVYMAGSFIGLTLFAYSSPSQFVLGASAGVFALEGMFFSLYYRKKALFLFTLFPIYFKRIQISVLWSFPIIFFIGEFTNLNNTSSVAHFAHVTGLIFGGLLGFVLQKIDNVSCDAIYPIEDRYLELMKKASTFEEICFYYQKIMHLNSQNWTASKVFLENPNLENIKFKNKFSSEIQKNVNNFFIQLLKNNDVKKQIFYLQKVPTFLIDWSGFLKEAPLSQVLFLADNFANQENWDFAHSLYENALTKSDKNKNTQVITEALKIIKTKQNLNYINPGDINEYSS